MKRSASTKMIVLTRKRSRRTRPRIRGQRKCTEPVASSSDLPTDHRRSDNHSESHQPQTLRSRCIGDSMDRIATGQAPLRPNSPQFATPESCRSGVLRKVSGSSFPGRRRARSRRHRDRSTTKCTEPVAPSSGFPTDCRRSGRRSESHQPRTLRTRCIGETRDASGGRQGTPVTTSRKLRSFLFATVILLLAEPALTGREKKKARAQGRSGQEIRRAGNAFVHLPDEPSASA